MLPAELRELLMGELLCELFIRELELREDEALLTELDSELPDEDREEARLLESDPLEVLLELELTLCA